MADGTAREAPPEAEPQFDENGVDLAQVRAMLDLTPAERLARAFSFMTSLLALRERHANRGSG